MDGMITSNGGQKIIRSLILLGLVLLFGTMGYMVLEGWNLLDALYMTVITITTVGYGETRTLDGHGRLFHHFAYFLGMGIMAYTIGMVAQTMVELQIRSILGRRKLGLNNKIY